MIGDIFFIVVVYNALGIVVALIALSDNLDENSVLLTEFFGVVLWWPFFVLKAVLMLVLWVVRNLHKMIISGFKILIGAERESRRRKR